jgi:predicted GIY-YIG superfamily endonuclease
VTNASFGWQARRRLSAVAREEQPSEGSEGGLNQSNPSCGWQASYSIRSTLAAGSLQERFGMPDQKRTVYVLKSDTVANCYYTGLTVDVAVRLATHNSGGSAHTAADRPWRVVVTLEFDEESKAVRFERYLKSGSGRAFARSHFR